MSTPPTPDQPDSLPQESRQEQMAMQPQVCQRPPVTLPPTPKPEMIQAHAVPVFNQETHQNNDQ